MHPSSNLIQSVSVKIHPQDTRHRYWAKIIRDGVALPIPTSVNGANDVPGVYARRGDEELFAGDILIEGEERHHRKNRGWDYWISYMHADGKLAIVKNPGATEKATMKANGLPAHLLSGSGEVAACIRLAHAVRLGIAYS